MAITEILGTDLPSDSRTVINDNFTDLDTTKADLASPTFTGTPSLPTGTTAVTQSASDNSTAVATTAYADAAVAAATQTVFDSTQVHNAATPNSWTDLDLSSVVGAAEKMVTLVITSTTTAYYGVRTKGTSYTFTTPGSTTNGTCFGYASSSSTTLMVKTDSSGVIQWMSQTTATSQVNVEAYW